MGGTAHAIPPWTVYPSSYQSHISRVRTDQDFGVNMALLDYLQLGQSLGAALREHRGSRKDLTSSVDKAIESYEKEIFKRME